MRDYFLFAIVFCSLPFILKRPLVGLLLYTWISLMNPHRLTYGLAYHFPFAAVVGAVTIVSLVFSKDAKRLFLTPLPFSLSVFLLWMTLTSFFASHPGAAWEEWNQVTKMMLMTLIAMLAINTKRDINAFAWVLGLSLGFYGLKGGFFTIASGGSSQVFGPQGTNIADNNDLALALVTTLPIVWYLHLLTTQNWLRRGLKVLMFATLISVAGTYSRGSFLAGSAMLFFLWMKSENKVRNGIVLALFAIIVLAVMPEKWFDRMESISEYREDASAMGRINAWHFAFNVAKENFMGGGFKNFTPEMFLVYAPDPRDFHAAHSIYFQVLGNHGFVGLALFLLLMIFAWRTGSRVAKIGRTAPDLKWALDLASMLQVSLVGYAVGGAFLSLAYFDLYYDIIALLVVLEKLVLSRRVNEEHNSSVSSPMAQRLRSN